jgi:hypothetical protein
MKPTPFAIPQYTESMMIEREHTLPSAIYLLDTQEEQTYPLPWTSDQRYLVGKLAYRLGLDHPDRVILSSKSWLSHPASALTPNLLPINHPIPQQRISPHQAAKIILQYLANAWNHIMAKNDPTNEFSQQQIVLTLPASFDEMARRLTLEAAQASIGPQLNDLTLLEEPLAAFYDWLGRQQLSETAPPLPLGSQILICDIGGGTTDFSLLSVSQAPPTPENLEAPTYRIQRRAVGPHLLLGGDNIDLALASWLYPKLYSDHSPSYALYQKLILLARKAKEEILSQASQSKEDDDLYTLLIQGRGRDVVRGSQKLHISKREVTEQIIKNFWILRRLDALSLQNVSDPLKDGNLPYEENTQFLDHLAHFLLSSQITQRPTHLLFNGGTMSAILFQRHVINALESWFPAPYPITLLDSHRSLHLAVSRGAAIFGMALRGAFLQIEAGTPQAYYLQVGADQVALLIPRYSKPGYHFTLPISLLLKVNTPITLKLYTSSTREEFLEPGALLHFNPQQPEESNLRPLPLLYTFLRYGKHNSKAEISITLDITLTHTGLIEAILLHPESNSQWRLEFSQTQREAHNAATPFQELEEKTLSAMQDLLEKQLSSTTPSPQLMKELELLAQQERKEWSAKTLRKLWETLHHLAPHRHRSPTHGQRWWNYTGFFLRPGYGYPLDQERIQQLWKIMLEEFSRPQAQGQLLLEQLICYRRIALGLTRGQQQQLLNHLLPTLVDKKKQKLLLPQPAQQAEYIERWRLLALLEWNEKNSKQLIGSLLLSHLPQLEHKLQITALWLLGHLAKRRLLRAPDTYLLPPEIAASWLEQLTSWAIPIWDRSTIPFKENFIQLFHQTLQEGHYPNLSIPQDQVQELLYSLPEEAQTLLHHQMFSSNSTITNELRPTSEEALYGEQIPVGILLTQESTPQQHSLQEPLTNHQKL